MNEDSTPPESTSSSTAGGDRNRERTADQAGLNRSQSQGENEQKPSSSSADSARRRPQSLAAEEFFYFFLRMRKGEVRRVASMLQTRYPDESPEQLSERLIDSKTRLALLGGTLANLPWLLPGIGQTFKLAGIVSAGSMLTRMNLYLINEIALVFGEDIEDTARVSDMMAVVAATAIGAAAPGVMTKAFGMNPWIQVPAGALSNAATTQLIGRAAVNHFRRKSTGHRPPSAEFEGTVEG